MTALREPRAPARRTVAAATAVAAAAGIAAGLLLVPAGERPAAPAPPRIGLASGVARLPLPADWRPLDRHATLPGFGGATAVRAGGAEGALDIRRPEDPSLLPAAAAAGRDLPAPRTVLADGRAAWRYDLPGPRPGMRIAAFALPTTGGVITLACSAPARRLDGVAAACARTLDALRLDGAAALAPAPEAAAQVVLPAAVARLDRVRRAERRRLATTAVPARRAASARRLAGAYAAAARTLAPVAGGAARGLPVLLARLAADHGRLAAASRRRAAPAARRANLAIDRDEGRLARRLTALTRPRRDAS